MQIIKFLTKDDEGYTCWCTTNQPKVFREFMQYVIDNCKRPEDYLLYDCDNQKMYSMMQIAKGYKMRKRSFAEKLKGVQTGTWKVEV